MLTSEQREALKELVSLVSNMHPTKWAVACSAINGILAASAAPAEGRECCNENCGWRGPADETVQMKHGYPNNLCPKCHEVTEVATAPTMGEAARAFSDEDARRLYDAACLTVMQRKRTRITFDAWCAEFIPALLAEIERIARAAAKEKS